MSEKLISRSPDLQRLRHEGYEVEVRYGYLVIHSVPYVTAARQIAIGKVVTDLKLNGDKTDGTTNHQVWFAGEFPCRHDGSRIVGIGQDTSTRTLCEGLVVDHRFSAKPPGGSYPDNHTKMTQYIRIITDQAKVIDPSADARTFKPVVSPEEDSVFLYIDSASSRAGIANVSRKTTVRRIAIVGLGGTGSYVLDFVAKNHPVEIHLFDGDVFLQHNAFRAPGAASLDDLEKRLPKVEYFAQIYGKMRRGIVTHPVFLDEANVSQLSGFDFVFICVDKPAVRKLLSEYLRTQSIPFVDTGMELQLIEETHCLIGSCRVTMSTPAKSDHFGKHVSQEDRGGDDLYATNIQVAELNALCAIMAILRWKKFIGFYQDCYEEHQSVYEINTHQLTRDETKYPPTA